MERDTEKRGKQMFLVKILIHPMEDWKVILYHVPRKSMKINVWDDEGKSNKEEEMAQTQLYGVKTCLKNDII